MDMKEASAMTEASGLKNEIDGTREDFPRRTLVGEGAFASSCEVIELRAPAVWAHSPLAFDPAFVLEAIERGIERALIDLQHVL